MFHDIILSKK
jgi:hypothetical protein